MPKSKKRKRADKKSAEDAAVIAARKPWRPPRLIQRLSTSQNRSKSGIDGHFEFDYMGSAEFEFGALNKALKAMRAAPDIHPEPIQISVEGIPDFWYVGTQIEEIIDWVKLFIVDQHSGKREIWLKERTDLRRAVDKDGRWLPDGWWAIDQPVPWLIFLNRESAKIWLRYM